MNPKSNVFMSAPKFTSNAATMGSGGAVVTGVESMISLLSPSFDMNSAEMFGGEKLCQ